MWSKASVRPRISSSLPEQVLNCELRCNLVINYYYYFYIYLSINSSSIRCHFILFMFQFMSLCVNLCIRIITLVSCNKGFLFPAEFLISDLRMSDFTTILTVRRLVYQALNYSSIMNFLKSTRNHSISSAAFFSQIISSHPLHIDLSQCWNKRRSCYAITLKMLTELRDVWVSRMSWSVTVSKI